ncbi:MAG: PQQ-dependent sugar dehydrogenase [Deltaproteobacteria bacterium]|nr:PQQ-dependent sugar dehydrogenase [Kofleriaceae bacterium]
MSRLALLLLVLGLLGCKRPAKVSPPADAVAVPPTDAELAEPIGSANPEVPGTVQRDDMPLPPSEALGAPPADVANLQLVRVAGDFERPVALVAAPGDPRKRLFVVEQVGQIRILENGAVKDGRVLDIRKLVSRDNEQGLLGLAFHPRFAENKKLYIHYTDRGGDTNVVEYQVSATDPDRIDLASERQILRVEQPYSNHNGGHVLFGPDDKLWVGLGDGGAAGDPLKAGQDDKQLLSKMLRIDVDAPRPKVEIVAKGLRNPWRYAFDPATGDLYIGDVGQNKWESIFVVPGDKLTGHNFGWSVAEGRHCYERGRCDMSKFTPPVADYDHTVGCSVTGGVVYRGKALPALDGVYFYADYCTAIIRSFRWRPDGIRQHWEWKPILDPQSRLGQVSSFGVDHDGEIYLLLLGGDILRLSSR